jgi:hypothetical protein
MESRSQSSQADRPLARREEARLMVDRAERNWQQQVANEQIPPPTGPRAVLRWILLAIALGAIVFLMFERLGQLG